MGEVEHDGVAVHAGFPNPAADGALGGLDLNKLLVRHGASTYFFRVEGSEWEEAGVFAGDIAIVDRALEPRAPDTVIWWHEANGEFAISRRADMPPGAAVWGVITSTIHRLREKL
jgi:SOS-response transcriptional repressor LexA